MTEMFHLNYSEEFLDKSINEASTKPSFDEPNFRILLFAKESLTAFPTLWKYNKTHTKF